DSRLDRWRHRCRAAGFALVAAVGLFFVITAVVGAVRWYSPVPIADMWDGYVTFYVRASAGDWKAWIEGHGPHVLLLSNLFFWLDLHCFQGLSLLLITLNLVFMAVLWAQLHFAASILLRPRKQLLFVTSALLLVPTFSWLHRENIVCGFQIQFFEALVFPLAAFQCLALSLGERRRRSWFSLSVVLGCLSAVTMGNGTLVLPLLIVMVAVSRQSVKSRILVLAPLSVAIFFFYFHYRGAEQIPFPGWSKLLEFVLLFLGSPFVAILKSRAHWMVAGVVMIGGAIFMFSGWLRSTRRDPMSLALLVFLAFIVLSAFGAGRSRVFFGQDQALVERYHTPALLGWATLAVLLVAHWRERVVLPRLLCAISAVLLVLLLPDQLRVFGNEGRALASLKRMSALALDLGVRDQERLIVLYPDDSVLKTAIPAKQQNLSVFGLPEMIRAREYQGRSIESLGLVECVGSLDLRRALPKHPGVSFATGWVFDKTNGRVPEDVYFADENNDVIGVAFTGGARPDIRRVVDPRAVQCGFNGYVRDAAGKVRLFCAPLSGASTKR
ncbi:MAG TPA: hypothetical protein VM509_07465, partial [Planctomycetota bacterium]|nr:hypothetical protein [Planctomycetota bacterium]